MPRRAVSEKRRRKKKPEGKRDRYGNVGEPVVQYQQGRVGGELCFCL